jgi:hypothetical protein
MNDSSSLNELADEWVRYLQQRGHRVSKSNEAAGILLSQCGHGNHYRWLLLTIQGPSSRLTAADHNYFKRQLAIGRKAGEQAYLVVRFDLPVVKLVVLPADRVLRIQILKSDRGGIPWDWPSSRGNHQVGMGE